MTCGLLLFLLVVGVTGEDEKKSDHEIFSNDNITEHPTLSYRGLIKFENQLSFYDTGDEPKADDDRKHSFVSFNDDTNRRPNSIKYPDDVSNNDFNSVEQDISQDQIINKQQEAEPPSVPNKKRRRRRKPRNQKGFSGYGYNQNLVQQNQGYGYLGGNQQYQNPYAYQGFYNGQQNRPLRPRPPPDALTTVVEALRSIASYDDYQCVPRMLCEAAGGNLNGIQLLQNLASVQPLLTLLAAYNGVSSSPLFVFGRAVFLGMTSNKNITVCQQSYPQCPSDPEQLIHYLNNHNGGFFRFFNTPQNNDGQQNIQQFYNQQAGQNYGLYQNQENAPGFYQNQGQGSPYLNQNQNSQQNYGYYNPVGEYQQNYGYPNIQRPSLYDQNYNSQQSYGNQYPYKKHIGKYGYQKENKYNKRSFNDINTKNKIEKRIQNKPNAIYIDDQTASSKPSWSFPEYNFNNDNIIISESQNVVNKLKFPDENNYDNEDEVIDYQNEYNNDNRLNRGFKFPSYGQQYYQKPDAIYDSYIKYMSDKNSNIINSKYSIVNNFQNNDKYNMNNAEIGSVVYVVRGNGDPNKPEKIILKPGQTL